MKIDYKLMVSRDYQVITGEEFEMEDVDSLIDFVEHLPEGVKLTGKQHKALNWLQRLLRTIKSTQNENG